MIKSNNQMILSLQVLHSYYSNNVCTCLQFTPVGQTTGLLNRFGIMTRPGVNGFELFVSPGTVQLSALLRYIANTVDQPVLEYQLTSANPYFLLFTELPFNQPGQLVYDTASADNKFGQGCLRLVEKIVQKPATVLGTLRISINDVLTYGGGAEPVRMQIIFNARSTQWQYYVVSSNVVQLDNPAVTAKNRDSFDGPANVTTATGQQALLFSSGARMLPLSQQPGYSYDLVNSSGSAGAAGKSTRIIYKGLPTPDPARIGAVTVDADGLISSPMYVYI